MINTNTRNGAIMFNCYPDFRVDLTCAMTPEALKQDVLVQIDEFYEFQNFIIIHRVYFHHMSISLNTKFLDLLPSHSKEIVLHQIDDDKPQVFTPKELRWMR